MAFPTNFEACRCVYPDKCFCKYPAITGPPQRKMEFTWHVYDQYQSDEVIEVMEDKLGFTIAGTPLEAKINRPFYEVTLECVIDTETGEVTLLEARLR